MVPAELDRTTIVIDISGSDAQFVATGEVIRFDGFLKLYSESTDEEPGEEGSGILPKWPKARASIPRKLRPRNASPHRRPAITRLRS